MRPGVFACILKANISSEIVHFWIKETNMINSPETRPISIFEIFHINLRLRPRPDENFSEDEKQLADALAAHLPDSLAPQPLPEIDPDEFEKLYGWFLS
jgi:hypothetical protein